MGCWIAARAGGRVERLASVMWAVEWRDYGRADKLTDTWVGVGFLP